MRTWLRCFLAAVLTTPISGLAGQDEPADFLIVNGNVYTADAAGRFAAALAIRGSRIAAVGERRDVERLQGPATRIIDARGGAVFPGFNDSHIHFVGGGLALGQVNLLDATTLEQIERKIRVFAAAHSEAPWVLGRGWYYAPFPGGLPVKEQLNALVPDRPAHMKCYDGHTSWVNSKALALAGITRDTPDPPNGIIVKDPTTGEPTESSKKQPKLSSKKFSRQ